MKFWCQVRNKLLPAFEAEFHNIPWFILPSHQVSIPILSVEGLLTIFFLYLPRNVCNGKKKIYYLNTLLYFSGVYFKNKSSVFLSLGELMEMYVKKELE